MTTETQKETFLEKAKKRLEKVTRRYEPSELQKSISQSYRGMRWATFLFAASWPFVLWLYGSYRFNIELQESMSAYYHTPMRNWFVGVCFILGVLLWVYKGFSRFENWLLNLAGLCAVLVALFPTGTSDPSVYTNPRAHGVSAIIFFTCCAIVCAFESRHSLAGHPHASRYKVVYGFLGFFMFALPVAAWVISTWGDASAGGHKIRLFAAEVFAVEVFAIYWAVKTYEIGKQDIDLVTTGKLRYAPT